MRRIPVAAVGLVSDAIVVAARRQLARLQTLADVLAWARAQTPPRRVTEIITQDEYTHDVVLPFDSSHFLVFDTT